MDRLLSIKEVAETLQVPTATLYRWRHHHEGPPALRVGKHLRYREGDLTAWLDRLASEEQSSVIARAMALDPDEGFDLPVENEALRRMW